MRKDFFGEEEDRVVGIRIEKSHDGLVIFVDIDVVVDGLHLVSMD